MISNYSIKEFLKYHGLNDILMSNLEDSYYNANTLSDAANSLNKTKDITEKQKIALLILHMYKTNNHVILESIISNNKYLDNINDFEYLKQIEKCIKFLQTINL
jgi:hypothetical protein